jgi:hypothetical protein
MILFRSSDRDGNPDEERSEISRITADDRNHGFEQYEQ